MQKIVTDRLTLREIKSKDIFGYSEIFSDKETMEQFGASTINNDLEIKNLRLSSKIDMCYLCLNII
jgi:RimJ/RimL family protein N-acetyltransferase